MELIEISLEEYQKYFPKNPNPFISIQYLQLNSNKTDSLICLVPSDQKYKLGLITGINEKVLKSPFSAPFGGFHFNNTRIYYNYIYNFVKALKKYIIIKEYRGIDLTMPPDFYHYSINTKFIHSMISAEFTLEIPEINNWIDLNYYNGNYPDPQVKRNIIKANDKSLTFSLVMNIDDRKKCFEIIVANRKRLKRQIHMSFNDILEMAKIVPIDFFWIKGKKGIVSSAIIYIINNNIVKVIFWGDSNYGRTIHAMDYLIDKLWKYYMKKDYTIIDVGTSTDEGIPNEGLIRFKENHGCHSSPKFNLKWRK